MRWRLLTCLERIQVLLLRPRLPRRRDGRHPHHQQRFLRVPPNRPSFDLLPSPPSFLLAHLSLSTESSQDVFRPGSASPSAILFEAAELFEKRSPKADEYIRNIKTELVVAVDTCIDAAGREFEVVWQKKLLRVSEARRGSRGKGEMLMTE